MPLSKQEALQIARQRLKEAGGEHDLVVLEDKIVEKEFGWVFLNAPQAFLETRDPNKSVPGFGPLVVSRTDGSTEFISTSGPPEVGIRNYEEKWRQANSR